jgi:hypothetical protein
MLSGLTRRFRLRAAITFAALYAFCVLLPPAALALTHAAAHCLTEQRAAHVHGKSAESHDHADGSVHQHDDQAQHSDAGDKAQNCCGLFCISAMPHEPGLELVTPLAVSRTMPAAAHALDGREPDRLRKPPRT